MDIFDRLTNNLIEHNDQGYALYFYNDGKELIKVNGKVKELSSDDITLDSNFRLASVSKQFIAYGIIRLIKNNKLSYDTCIRKIFLDLPEYFENITIKNLLNHTSGIYNYEEIPHLENDTQIQDQDVLEFLKTTEGTYFDPGTKYRYSNTAYVLLGLIIERVSGIKLGDYFDIIFKEAGMNDSVVNYQGKTLINNRAYGHLIDQNNKLYVKDQYWASATIGDGGLYSSINDLMKWCLYLSETEEFRDMSVPNFIGETEYNEYGFGIRIIKVNDKEIFYHCGDTIGTSTLLLFSKDLNICLLFLTNLGNVDTSIMKDNLLNIIKNKE